MARQSALLIVSLCLCASFERGAGFALPLRQRGGAGVKTAAAEAARSPTRAPALGALYGPNDLDTAEGLLPEELNLSLGLDLSTQSLTLVVIDDDLQLV